jgi:hypothetical protein
MAEKKEIIGDYTDDGNIYCVDCINKAIEMMKEIDRAMTSDDLEENPYVGDGCKGEIK